MAQEQRDLQLRQGSVRNRDLMVSWNKDLLLDPPPTQGLDVSKSQTPQSSIVDDGGASSYLADNPAPSHRLSLGSSKAELVSYSDGGFANTSRDLESRDFEGSAQFDNSGEEDVLKEIHEYANDESLGDSIRMALQTSHSEGKEQKFLPNDSLDKIVSWERVRHELELHRHEIGPGKDLDKLADDIWTVASPSSPSKTRPKETTRKKIFAILGLMEKLEDIVDFIQAQLYDYDLPFLLCEGLRPGSRQMKRRSKDGQHSIELFGKWKTFELESFNTYQWQLTAPYFHLSLEKRWKPQHYIFQKETILPFTRDEEIGARPTEGGYGEVWRVKIHPAHHNRANNNSDSPNSNPWYAVKRLRTRNQDDFNKEALSLKMLHHEHLIKLLATFVWCDQFYLLFPCANGNLLDFWQEYPNPSDPVRGPDMAQWFSEQCLGIVEGLKIIHTAAYNKNNSGHLIHGRHGDLKPENILWFRNHTDQGPFGNLKISDFGLTRFHRSESNTLFENVGVSRTYRPPEYDIANMVSQRYDIWALGCVLLEFVTWYLLGWDEVARFSKERMTDDLRHIPEDCFFHFVWWKERDGQIIIGAKAKQSVANQFQKLYEDCSDFTLDLLTFIETSLLRIGPKKRESCEHIVNKLNELFVECQRDPEYCTKRLQPLPKTRTDLSELPAAALNLSKEMRDQIDKKLPHIPQHIGPLENDSQPSIPTVSQPQVVENKGKMSENVDLVIRTTSPRESASIFRSATVQSDRDSAATQSPRQHSPRKVRFDPHEHPVPIANWSEHEHDSVNYAPSPERYGEQGDDGRGYDIYPPELTPPRHSVERISPSKYPDIGGTPVGDTKGNNSNALQPPSADAHDSGANTEVPNGNGSPSPSSPKANQPEAANASRGRISRNLFFCFPCFG